MWNLERALSELTGLPHVSLQPSAGSHGELAGLLLTRAYHEDRGQERTKVLTPDTAHGTNPATVTMAGYEVVKVATAPDGGRRPGRPARQGRRDGRLPDAHQPQHARALRPQHPRDRRDRPRRRRHPLLRRRQPERDHGLVAARRHGLRHRPPEPPQVVLAAARRRRARAPGRSRSPTGSRPSCRCRGSSAQRARTAPVPASTSSTRPRSRSARMRGFQGNFGVFVRSYAYIRSLGGDGLREASETAVLNANYLLAKLVEGPRRQAPAARRSASAACTSSSSPATPPGASSR